MAPPWYPEGDSSRLDRKAAVAHVGTGDWIDLRDANLAAGSVACPVALLECVGHAVYADTLLAPHSGDASEKQPPALMAPGSVHGVELDPGVEEQKLTPKAPSPQRRMCQALP